MKKQRMGWLWAGLAWAAGYAAVATESPKWEFEVTPYLWLAALDGDVDLNGRTLKLNPGSSGPLDDVDPGGSLFALAQYSRWVAGLQLDFMRPKPEVADAEDPARRGELDSEWLLAQLAVGYRLDGWKPGQSFTVAVGVRNLHMDNELVMAGEDGERGTADITDPMVFLWPSVPLFASKIQGLSLSPVFAVGGGGDSKWVYELSPQLRYQFSEHFHVRVGYRTGAYRIDDDVRRAEDLDCHLAGLTIGLGGRF